MGDSYLFCFPKGGLDKVIFLLRTALVVVFLSFSSAGWAASIQTVYDMSRFLSEPHPFDTGAAKGAVAPLVSAPIPTWAGDTRVSSQAIQPAPTKAEGGVWRLEFQNEDRGFLEKPLDAVFDNFYGDRDDKTGHLTWAWKVAYAPNRNPDWFESNRKYIRWLVGDKTARLEYSLQQSASVPNSGNVISFLPDRPYVGLLIANLQATFADDFKGSHQGVDQLNLSIGLAGPASVADVVHRVAHSLIGRNSSSWDQITSEPVVILQYEKGGRFVFGGDKIGFEAFPHLGATVGNGYTYGAVGTTLRVGSHLRKDSGAPRMRMITTGTNFPTPGSYFVWNLFTGIEGRIMGHNIMIDGNSFKDTSDVESLHWVLDSQLGAELGWGAYRMSVMGVYRTKEFNDQEQDDLFLRAGFSAPL